MSAWSWWMHGYISCFVAEEQVHTRRSKTHKDLYSSYLMTKLCVYRISCRLRQLMSHHTPSHPQVVQPLLEPLRMAPCRRDTPLALWFMWHACCPALFCPAKQDCFCSTSVLWAPPQGTGHCHHRPAATWSSRLMHNCNTGIDNVFNILFNCSSCIFCNCVRATVLWTCLVNLALHCSVWLSCTKQSPLGQ